MKMVNIEKKPILSSLRNENIFLFKIYSIEM